MISYQRLRLLVLLIFVTFSYSTNIITPNAVAAVEHSSESSEEDGSTEDDAVYSILHSAMDNLTTRVSSMSVHVPEASNPLYNSTTLYHFSKLSNVTDTDVVQDDDFDYDGQMQDWKTKDTVQGYEISSDGLQFKSKLLPVKGLVHIRVDVGSAWTMDKEIHRRNLNLKIMTWERTHRIKVKVPYGSIPEELKVVEQRKYMDIFAPYGFLEFQPQKTIYMNHTTAKQ